MKLAFLMPDEPRRHKIAALQERIFEMRPDQTKQLEHLLRSWRIFGRYDGIELTQRAIKRVLQDRP